MPNVTQSSGNPLEDAGFRFNERQLDGVDISLSQINEVIPDASLSMTKLNPISYGQTEYDNGIGYWLGVKDNITKFSLGNSAGNKLLWDGSLLSIVGTITVTSGSIGGITINSTSITYGKTSFSDSTNAGFYIGQSGIYFGAVSDTSKLKYTIADGTFDFIGTISSRSTLTLASAINSSGNLVTDIINARIDSSAKTILSDFNFGLTNYTGAVKAGDITWNTTTGAITGGSGVVVYRGGIVGASAGVATFSIDSATGTATFGGTLSAPTGNLGGWLIGAASLTDAAGSVGLSSAVTGGDDIRFWAGNVTPTSAPFKVTEAGALTASSATISGALTTSAGSSIGSTYLSGLVPLSNVNLAAQGWTFTGTFSATDYNTITWTAGTLTSAAGTAYTIDAGNTGNMSAVSYIYLDIAVSSTVLQVTTTATTANGSGKVHIATASSNTDTTSKAIVQAFGGTGGQILLVDNLSANSASTNEFVSNTAQIANLIVTNAKINDLAVSKLTAGTITSKAITLAVSEGAGDVFFNAGKTDFDNTQSGFILGCDDSDSNKPKFYIGDTSNYFNWTGSTLVIKGDIDASATIGGVQILPLLAIEYGENLTAGDAVSTIRSDVAYGSDITVSADTYVREDAPFNTQNFDSETEAVFYNGAGNDRETLLQFSTGWPTDMVRIVSFDLIVNVITAAVGSAGIYAVTDSFTSSSVTWNTKPAQDATSLGSFSYSSTGSKTVSCTVPDQTISDKVKNKGLYIVAGSSAVGGIETLENAGSSPAYITNLVYLARDGKIWKSDATYLESVNEFVGFCIVTANAGTTTKPFQFSGVLTTSGLTAGSVYYLSDTKGAISVSAGTNSKKIGKSISATQLLIKNDND